MDYYEFYLKRQKASQEGWLRLGLIVLAMVIVVGLLLIVKAI